MNYDAILAPLVVNVQLLNQEVEKIQKVQDSSKTQLQAQIDELKNALEQEKTKRKNLEQLEKLLLRPQKTTNQLIRINNFKNIITF